jgi:outer membrane protein insertion porin family
VREKYLDKGYLDVKVAEPRLEPTGKGKVNVVFAVEEGAPYVVESLSLTGISLFPTNALEEVAFIQPGEIAGRTTIQNAVKNVRDYYGARGYIDTMVRPTVETSEENPGKAAIKMEVREGALVRIRNIVIQGNTRTKDKVIRREIATAIAPGEVMNEPLIERSENRIKNLNYFTEVRHYTAPGDTEENRDLVFDLKEQLRTGKFMIGAGFSSVDGVVGFAEVNQSNFDIANWPYFTGGGQKARAGVELGSKRQTVELGWTEPWFLDKPMALSVELYRRMRSYTEYDETRTGAGVGISYPVKVGRIGFKYTLEQINLDDQLWGPYFRSEWWHPGYFLGAYRFTDEKDSAINSSLRVSWTHDTRDQAFVPTRGMLLTVFGEVAGAVLGGENDIYSVGAQARRWFKMPWNEKHVLSLRARFETVEAYSGDVPIYERLYLGGGRTVRGIDYRDIGPKVIGLNRKWHPIGGQTLVNAGAEYSIPLFDKVRIAGFTDFGSLDEDAFSPDFSDIAVTAGLGLRIDIPGFPVRLDYATPIVKPDNADTSAFVLWIGFE